MLLESDLAPQEGGAPPRVGLVVAAVAGGGALTALIAWLLAG